jgi:hypothetical protein
VYGNGGNKERYKDLQKSSYCDAQCSWYLRMEYNLSFELVSSLCACFTRDAQYQRTDKIAIQKENDFWQPPSEPLRIDQCEAGFIKCN